MSISDVERAKLKTLVKDPVAWAKAFVISYDANLKKHGPWEARWYQQEMMRDKSLRKVYRCGRRTGKTDTMVLEGMHKTFTRKNFRVLYVTPYENQIRLIFLRLKELVNDSPELKKEVANLTMNPYMLRWKNGSILMGFTTGASSGSGAASIRGQRADWVFMDECDYLGEGDFDTVTMIAGERSDIGMTISSTPTGKRGKFYEACTNKAMGFNEHYHPSTHNPNWNDNMEAEFRAQLTASGYDHEVLAIFGVEEAGVFSKDKVDGACSIDYYAYQSLTQLQINKMRELGVTPAMYIFSDKQRPPQNPFRCMGVDWDKYGASSSIVILDFDIIAQKFRVMLRIEVPRAEYSYDAAVNLIVDLNDRYNPSWIYADRGSGEYQIERLHIIGDERPFTGLKNKVKGWQFKNKIEVFDPITREKAKEPMKPFMVNQLTIAFEREKIILSPFDEIMHKQLVDYTVERISQNGDPVFTDENEHAVDALGLAYLAFVQEFSDLTDQIKKPEFTSKMLQVKGTIGQGRVDTAIRNIESRPVHQPQLNIDPTELRGDRPNWVKMPLGAPLRPGGGASWGSRGRGIATRSLW